MDETLYTRNDLHECAIVSDEDDLTLNLVTNLEVSIEAVPRMWSELLVTESDSLLLLIEIEYNDLDLLVELYELLRVIYAAPREVCDMDETVNATEVNEYTCLLYTSPSPRDS